MIGESSTSLVLPAWNELIWGTLAFVFFLLLLWRAGVWKRLGAAMDERTRRIRSDLENAEAARLEAERLLQQYREQLQQAREDARQIVEDAKRRADQTRQELIQKAERDAEMVRTRAEQEIDAQLQRAKAELRREVGVLSVRLAERVIGDTLDVDRQLRLVDQYIEDLAAAGNGGGASA
ncbi:MAG: F0F1 ATP synthase subunit B [Actinomycetota bacterium]